MDKIQVRKKKFQRLYKKLQDLMIAAAIK